METEQTPVRPGVALGRVLGFPVRLSPSWFVMAVLVMVGWGLRLEPEVGIIEACVASAALVASFLLSVLLHELGHALVARRFGIGVRGITLNLLGGYTEMERESTRPGPEIAYALAGPAVSLVLGLAFLGGFFVTPHGVARLIIGQLAFSNLVVAVYNALPGLPLDGGRALRAVVWAITGNQHRATIVAGWTGRIVAAVTAALALLGERTGYLTLVGALLVLFVALNIWQSAGAALSYARVASRYPLIDPVRLCHTLYQVPTGTSLAEAVRRAEADGLPSAALGVADSSGTLTAIVVADAAAAVPEQRRPWVAVETLARSIEGMGRIPAGLIGEDVINVVRSHPGDEWLVTSGDDVIGVLRIADLVRLLDPRIR